MNGTRKDFEEIKKKKENSKIPLCKCTSLRSLFNAVREELPAKKQIKHKVYWRVFQVPQNSIKMKNTRLTFALLFLRLIHTSIWHCSYFREMVLLDKTWKPTSMFFQMRTLPFLTETVTANDFFFFCDICPFQKGFPHKKAFLTVRSGFGFSLLKKQLQEVLRTLMRIPLRKLRPAPLKEPSWAV